LYHSSSAALGRKKRQPNLRRREKEKRRRELWLERRHSRLQPDLPAAAAVSAAATATVSTAAATVPREAATVAVASITEGLAAYITTAEKGFSSAFYSPATSEVATAAEMAPTATATPPRKRTKAPGEPTPFSSYNAAKRKAAASPALTRTAADPDLNVDLNVVCDIEWTEQDPDSPIPPPSPPSSYAAVAGAGVDVETPCMKKQPPSPPPYSKFFPPTSHEVICRVCWQGRHTFRGTGFDRCYVCRFNQRGK
jgi:hypothetical protein